MPRFLAALALACALVLIPLSDLALAQSADTRVSLGGVWDAVAPYLVSLVSAAMIALLSWLTALFHRWTGIQIEAKHREALHSAVMTGVLKAMDAIGTRADAVTVDVRSRLVKDASEWVLRSVPDAVKALGVDNNALRELVLSKLQAVQNPGVTARV